MKKRTFQIFAIALAFCLGVAINYSCGDSYQSEQVSVSYSFLWNEIKRMQNEIQQLKDDIANLNSGGGSSDEFQVNGVWFNRFGFPSGLQKETTYSLYGSNGNISQNSSYNSLHNYEYDNYGRIIKQTENIMYSNGTTQQFQHLYQYNGNTVTYSLSTYNDGTISWKQVYTYTY